MFAYHLSLYCLDTSNTFQVCQLFLLIKEAQFIDHLTFPSFYPAMFFFNGFICGIRLLPEESVLYIFF